jgi:hypothetical protein
MAELHLESCCRNLKIAIANPNNGRFLNAIVRPPGAATAAATGRRMEQAVEQLVFKPWNQKVQKREKTQGANVPLVL